MTPHGFYILKDEFFIKVNDPYLKNNKDGNRPFYYCIKDSSESEEIFWMIPMSSRVEKYKEIIRRKHDENKPCDGLHVCRLPNDKESAFLIQDIFPITAKYVDREYTIGQNHLILPYQDDINLIQAKARKVIKLVKRGIKLTPTSPDIRAILNKIKEHEQL